MRVLREALAEVRPLDGDAMARAVSRQQQLTKPPGSLGVLEAVSVQLCGITGSCPPPLPSPAAAVVFAADHGVHAQDVTRWPQEVTAQMVANLVAGTAAVNVLARQSDAQVLVVDVGVAADLPPAPALLPRKVRHGTRDLSAEPAMTRDEAVAAVEVGIDVARDLHAEGHRCLLVGEMGIANTTASSALIAALTGSPPSETTGRGAGVDDETWRHKVAVVEDALATRPVPTGQATTDPLAVLASLGGLEHAAIAGLALGAAACRVPLVLDGVVTGAAALVAQALCPAAIDYCVAGHRSAEPGHAVALDALGLRPLVDLDLRLGEGSGAVLALRLVRSSAAILREMATFDSAGVTDSSRRAD